jgi:DNA processing protein
MDEEYRLACAALSYLAEPADQRLAAVVAACGPQATVDAITRGALPAPAAAALGTGPSARKAAGLAMQRWRTRLAELPAKQTLDAHALAGIRLVCPGDPEWPSRLDDLAGAAPYALWVRGNGDLRFACVRSVAVVGSRAATGYGSWVATEMAADLAAAGWTVVSGAAYGIDAAAHRSALGADGITVAILACGADQAYPVGHAGLLDHIAAGGVVASEWPPGRTPTRMRFLVRNRVIAALTTATVVVEAGERSGALNTARHARDLHRTIMAVPGPVTSQASAGCHVMIREWQATLVRGAEDVLEMVRPFGEMSSGGQPPRTQALARDLLNADQAAVLDALPARGGAGPATIAALAGIDMATVLASLGALAATGLAERCPRGWRASKAATDTRK